MLSVLLDSEIESQLEILAKFKCSSTNDLIRNAVIRMIEDEEDLVLTKQASQETLTSKPLAQVRKEFGLDS